MPGSVEGRSGSIGSSSGSSGASSFGGRFRSRLLGSPGSLHQITGKAWAGVYALRHMRASDPTAPVSATATGTAASAPPSTCGSPPSLAPVSPVSTLNQKEKKPKPTWPPEEWFAPCPPPVGVYTNEPESTDEDEEAKLRTETPALSFGTSRESTLEQVAPESGAINMVGTPSKDGVLGPEAHAKRASAVTVNTSEAGGRPSEADAAGGGGWAEPKGKSGAQLSASQQVLDRVSEALAASDPTPAVVSSPIHSSPMVSTRQSLSDPTMFVSPANTQSLAPGPCATADLVVYSSPVGTQNLAHPAFGTPARAPSLLRNTSDLYNPVVFASPGNTQSLSPDPTNLDSPAIFASPANTQDLDPLDNLTSPTTPPCMRRPPLPSPRLSAGLSPRLPPLRPPNSAPAARYPLRTSSPHMKPLSAAATREGHPNAALGGGFLPPPPRMATHSSFASTSSSGGSAGSADQSAVTGGISKGGKLLKPPQHPSIVKQRNGGQMPVKETLDATAGLYEDGSRMVNQYILRQELGRGSFGAVQLATDAETGRDYAVKVFSKSRLRRKLRMDLRRGKPSGSEDCGGAGHDALYLIRNEVAIMKKVNHPNVVALHEVLDVESEDSLYLVMEYCRGGSLMHKPAAAPAQGSDADLQGVALDENTARKYFRQIVVGIDYLHQNEVIHHDIKPDNILLTSDRLTCKIADFGVSAMFVKPGDDSSFRSMGSPAFASPELCAQATRRSGGGRGLANSGDGGVAEAVAHVSGTAADIWAMGVTLWVMLTGKLPFGKEGEIVRMYDAIQEDNPQMPQSWSENLKDVMARLLDKDQDSRIRIAQLREHPWITSDGRRPLPSASENSQPVGLVTDSDLRQSFRHAISSGVQGFVEILEQSVAYSRKFGETHDHGRRRAFFREFYRQISSRQRS